MRTYEFELGHNVVEATNIIPDGKGEGSVDYYTVNIWFKKFCLVAKTSTIRQSQVGVKPWILRPYSKL